MNAICLKNKFAVILGYIIFRNNDPFGSFTHAPISERFLTFQALLYLDLGFSLVKQVQKLHSIQYYSFHSHYFFFSHCVTNPCFTASATLSGRLISNGSSVECLIISLLNLYSCPRWSV